MLERLIARVNGYLCLSKAEVQMARNHVDPAPRPQAPLDPATEPTPPAPPSRPATGLLDVRT